MRNTVVPRCVTVSPDVVRQIESDTSDTDFQHVDYSIKSINNIFIHLKEALILIGVSFNIYIDFSCCKLYI